MNTTNNYNYVIFLKNLSQFSHNSARNKRTIVRPNIYFDDQTLKPYTTFSGSPLKAPEKRTEEYQKRESHLAWPLWQTEE